MFVSCGNCEAEYELDDAKIPAGGARLRCTSCNHSFVVRPPEASDVESADDLARDALSAPRPEADPDPAPQSEPVKSFDFSDEAEPDAAFEAAMDEGFDLDIEAASEGEIETASDEGFDLNGEVDPGADFDAASGEGIELDGDVYLNPELDAPSDEALDLDAEADSDSEFGAISEEGLEAEAEAEADPDSEFEAALDAASNEDAEFDGESDWEFNDEIDGVESDAGGRAPEPRLDRGDDWSDLSTAEDVVDDLLGAGAPIGADAAAAVDDLLGEIDRGDSPPRESGGKLRSDPALPSQQLDLGDGSASDGSGDDLAADAGFEDLTDWELFDQADDGDGSAVSAALSSRAGTGVRAEPNVGISLAMAGDSATTVRWTDRLSEMAGWTAVCLLAIVALAAGLAPNASDANARSGNWSGGGFEADQIVGRWVDNAVAGSIYVVSGRVRRTAGADPAARTTLAVRLIDAKGREIDRAPIPLTPAVPERVLHEFSPAQLDDFQQQRASRIALVGERWIHFEAVLTDLPRFAGRFDLQAIDR